MHRSLLDKLPISYSMSCGRQMIFLYSHPLKKIKIIDLIDLKDVISLLFKNSFNQVSKDYLKSLIA